MDAHIQDMTLQQFVTAIGDQHQPMTGAVIAGSAMQVIALGEACVQISLDNQLDKLNWQEVSQRIQTLTDLRNQLITWCDHEKTAISEYLTFLEDNSLVSRTPLIESCTQIGQLTLQATKLLIEFRPLVYKDVHDDLEVTINFLTHLVFMAKALLRRRLQRWFDQGLHDKYTPIADLLDTEFQALQEQALL